MVTIKVVKIGQEVLDKIESNKKYDRETPDDILKRLLKLNITPKKGS